MNSYFATEIVEESILVLTMDAPGQSANTMDEAFRVAIKECLDELEERRDSLTGIVLTSAKSTFFAGGDLGFMMRATPADAGEIAGLLRGVKLQLRRLETLGVPVVAALNGAALGGGFEIALAAHHRIALNGARTKVGLPEVTFGLLPGGGGTTRTVRMFGIQKALQMLLLRGQQYVPSAALELGLIDDVVATQDELVPRAVEWIKANPSPVQPWDTPGFRIPGGNPSSPELATVLPALASTLRKQSKGAPSLAARNILAAAVEGAQVDFTTALEIETSYCTELICSQTSANIIKSQFFDMQHIQRGKGRPEGYPTTKVNTVAVIGAGMMGAAIAYVCAKAGLQVVLRDMTIEAAERGKGYAAKILDARMTTGKVSAEQSAAILQRIQPTDALADAASAEVVIEAVFENPDVKKQVFAELQTIVGPDTVLASNTSTLPITDLATAVERRENFIGLHFFSPVDKMPLLEIVVGERTSDETLARALDLAAQIGKTPIVVNDAPGFFTTRVIVQYVLEAVAAVGEGIAPASIEQAAMQAGYPVGPLALVDELTLTLLRDIDNQAAAHRGVAPEDRHPGIAVLERLIERGRTGRSKGAGFYEYDDDGRRVGIWAGLAQEFPLVGDEVELQDLADRMLYTESIDSIRCLDEGVLRSVPDANVGSILGIGFPSWTGGVLQFVNQVAGGPAAFVARAEELARQHGVRLSPPASII